jgi:DNA-damage-inducible protein D
MDKLEKMENDNSDNDYQMFEDIKHIDENGVEYWYARELQVVFKYVQWRRFEDVINKAKIACKNSGFNIDEHFANVGKTIKMPKNAEKSVMDYKLTRYASYLTAQNGDVRKKVIAQAQTYFAIQARKQELSEKEYHLLSEEEKRFYIRKQTKNKNLILYQVAKNAGVKNFDNFTNSGYKGLYNGETADDIANRKGLRYREEILDNMGSSELIANLFRIDQTEQKITNENIKGEKNANNAHYKIGKIVRNAIKQAGGTMPENLPTPEKSLKQIEKENNRKIR